MKKILSILIIFFMSSTLSSTISACSTLKLNSNVYNYNIVPGTSKSVFNQVYNNLLNITKNKNTNINTLKVDKKLKVDIYFISNNFKSTKLDINDDKYNILDNSKLKLIICIRTLDSYFISKYWKVNMYYITVKNNNNFISI